MKRRKIILITLALIITVIGIYAWLEYTRTNKDLATVRADHVFTANELLSEFEKNDSLATKRFNGKVLEVTGSVRKLEIDEMGYYTIVVSGNSSMSAVRCSMDTTHNKEAPGLTEGSPVTVRGICTGYNKDELGLGSDVILNRCAIIDKQK